MAITQYSPIPNQQVIRKYEPEDFRYLIAAGQQKQQAYSEAEAFDQQQEGVFGKYAVRDVDIARRDAIHNEYIAKAQDIVQNQFQGDYGQALPSLRKLANGYAGNQFFNRAASALAQQKDMYETEKAIQKKGGTALGFNRDAHSKAVYNEDGTYNDVSYDVQERLDYSKPKRELMEGIAKDSSLAGLSQSQIAGVLQHGSMKGVNAAKVIGVAKNMLAPYLSTPEGVQEKRYYMAQGATAEQAEASMLRSLAGIGSKQIGSEQDMGYLTDPTYLHRLKKAEKEAEANKDMLIAPEGLTGMSANPLAPDKLSMDEKGRPYVTGQVATSVTRGKGEFGTTEMQDYKDYNGAKPMLEAYRKNYLKLNPGDSDISDKKLVELHNQAVENSGNVAMRTVGMSPKRAATTSQMLLGQNYKKGDIANLQGSQIMVVSPTGKGGQLVTMPEMMEEFGVGKDKKIVSAQVTGRNPYNPQIPGAYRVTLTVAGKNGESPVQKEILVSGNQQEQQFNAQYQPLVQAAYAGKNGRVTIGGVTFKNITAPGKDGKFHHEVRGYETLPNGNVVPLRERLSNGKIKTGKDGRPVYAPKQSLDSFTNSMRNVFLSTYGDMYNAADYTEKEAKDEPDFTEE
jgi:hypothetical protein